MSYQKKKLDICEQNFGQYSKEDESFLKRIIAFDATWIHQ